MNVLLIAEHDQQHLSQATYSAMQATLVMEAKVDVLVLGDACSQVVEQARLLQGVSQVYFVDEPVLKNPLAQVYAPIIKTFANAYNVFICAATCFGKDLMPRLAALLGISLVSDVVEVIGIHEFIRTIYAGNAREQLRVHDPVYCVTVRASAFPAVALTSVPAPLETRPCSLLPKKTTNWQKLEQPNQGRPDLTSAQIVVAGGRGVGSADHFKLLEKLADVLGAALGASRAAVDAGFVSNDLQVGQTGKIVAPKLYIAIGISGAIQHLAGMKDAGVIVAINHDPNAPIFDVADYGLVGDLHEIVPALIAELEAA